MGPCTRNRSRHPAIKHHVDILAPRLQLWRKPPTTCAAHAARRWPRPPQLHCAQIRRTNICNIAKCDTMYPTHPPRVARHRDTTIRNAAPKLQCCGHAMMECLNPCNRRLLVHDPTVVKLPPPTTPLGFHKLHQPELPEAMPPACQHRTERTGKRGNAPRHVDAPHTTHLSE